jgi:hypothetical protein
MQFSYCFFFLIILMLGSCAILNKHEDSLSVFGCGNGSHGSFAFTTKTNHQGEEQNSKPERVVDRLISMRSENETGLYDLTGVTHEVGIEKNCQNTRVEILIASSGSVEGSKPINKCSDISGGGVGVKAKHGLIMVKKEGTKVLEVSLVCDG